MSSILFLLHEGSRLLTVRGILPRSVWRVCSLAEIQMWALKTMGACANGYPHATGGTRVRSATMEHNAQDNERELCPVIICNLDFIIARWCAAVQQRLHRYRTRVDAFPCYRSRIDNSFCIRRRLITQLFSRSRMFESRTSLNLDAKFVDRFLSISIEYMSYVSYVCVYVWLLCTRVSSYFIRCGYNFTLIWTRRISTR